MSPPGSPVICDGTPDFFWSRGNSTKSYEPARTLGRRHRGGLRRLLGNELAHGLRHPGAFGNPMLNAVLFEMNGGRGGTRVVGAHNFHRPSVARAFFFNHDHAIIRFFARTNAR